MSSVVKNFSDNIDFILNVEHPRPSLAATNIVKPSPTLTNLALELKVEIILYLKNPTFLARCSREWNDLVNLPSTKAKWLIFRHGRTHALFHAVRMGEPFINLDVVECLFAQKAHISRYFVQRLVLGFGKYDSRLIDLKLTHNMGALDPDREKFIQKKIRSPWASNLSFDVFSRILKEGHDRFDGNDIPVRGNDMESFYYLSAGPLVISQARTKLKENKKEIKTLILRYKFAPFPHRPKIRKHILEKKGDGEIIGLKSNSDMETESHTANFDDYPPSDGYENVRQLNVIARAILIYPKLVTVWKKNGYHEIVNDVNDLVMQGSLLILYPPNPPEGWTEPGLDQVVEKLNSLILLGFELTDAVIGDVLILFKRKLRNIGDTLVRAFAIVKKKNVLPICLRELLNSERTFKHHDSLEFVVNRIDEPEKEILFQIKKNRIENPLDIYLGNNSSIPLAYTILKYSPIIYEYMLEKFGPGSPITRYLMKEIVTARIGEAKLRESFPTLASSFTQLENGWLELDRIFKIYCMKGVSFEPQFLPIIENCPSDAVIKCLFGYLSRLFGFKFEYPVSEADQIPLLGVTPFAQRNVNASSDADREEWLNVIQRTNITGVFRSWLEIFGQRLR